MQKDGLVSEDSEEGLSVSGRIKAKLIDTVDVWVSGDYGCGHAVISENHLNTLMEKGVKVRVELLSAPETMKLAVQNEKKRELGNNKWKIIYKHDFVVD